MSCDETAGGLLLTLPAINSAGHNSTSLNVVYTMAVSLDRYITGHPCRCCLQLARNS
jgi:hypothetical protein